MYATGSRARSSVAPAAPQKKSLLLAAETRRSEVSATNVSMTSPEEDKSTDHKGTVPICLCPRSEAARRARVVSLVPTNGPRTQLFVTKYEKARILAMRARHISMGAPLTTEPPEGECDSLKIAMAEYRRGKVPFTLVRTLPDGNVETVPFRSFRLKDLS